MTTPTLALPAPARRGPSLVLPLTLIALGGVFLLANAGYLSGLSWRHVLVLWPVIFVLIGVDLLLRPRSMIAAAIAEIAIIGASLLYLVAAPVLPFGSSATGTGAYTSQESVVREGASRLSLTLGYGAGNLTLRGGATDLVTVRSTQQDIDLQPVTRLGSSANVELRSIAPNFAVVGPDRSWDVTIPSDIPVGLTLNLGAGDFDVDLGGVALTHLTINNGASDLTLALPKAQGNVPVTISTGASSVDLRIPSGVEYRVRVTGAVNSVSGSEQSAGYASATDRLTITVSAGASSIVIH